MAVQRRPFGLRDIAWGAAIVLAMLLLWLRPGLGVEPAGGNGGFDPPAQDVTNK